MRWAVRQAQLKDFTIFFLGEGFVNRAHLERCLVWSHLILCPSNFRSPYARSLCGSEFDYGIAAVRVFSQDQISIDSVGYTAAFTRGLRPKTYFIMWEGIGGDQ